MESIKLVSDIIDHFKISLSDTTIEILPILECRVENFFAIHLASFFHKKFKLGEIKNYKMQYHIKKGGGKRVHVDFKIIDNKDVLSFIEIKHFAITSNRNFKFYTGFSEEQRKLGVIGDFEKLDNLRKEGLIPSKAKTYCCVFVTPNVISLNEKQMINVFNQHDLSKGWTLVNHVHDSLELGVMLFEKQ
jgi:hypothetical protein